MSRKLKRTKLLAITGALGLASAAIASAPSVLADEHDSPTTLQETELTLTEVAVSDYPIAGVAGPSDTVWIAERDGLVRVLDEQGLGTPVLDISDEVTTSGESGLLGIAFDPGFEHFYASFTDLDGNTSIDEFAVADGQLQPETRRVVFTQEQPFPNHNGGHIAFGPDGMLYIGLGDGGSSFDPNDNGQNLNTFLGKILRIDPAGGLPYAIPPDNPFVGDPNALDEIWAYGLRNPWRFSFDAVTGEMWIGDVGQNEREEIDRAPAGVGGQNYGWARMEGTLPVDGTEPVDHTPPVHQYETDGAHCAVTGGYVYRGEAIPDLQGAYLYSDFCDANVRTLEVQDGQVVDSNLIEILGGATVSFVQGPDLEIYVLDVRFNGGTISRIDPVEDPGPTDPTTDPVEDDCSATIEIVNDWGSGWQGNVNVTAGENQIDGWTLNWTWPGGQSINSHWNADVTAEGTSVTAGDIGWNGSIAAGQTLNAWGFIGTGDAVAPEVTCSAT